MSALSLLVVLLGAPNGASVTCPADQGNIRWDGFSFEFQAHGKKHDAVGSLWDRDRNGKPSKGDLMRIDTATAGGRAMGVSEVWITLGGNLAGRFAKRFAKIGPRLSAECESRFELEGVPQMSSPEALAKHLRAQDSSAVQQSPTEAVEQSMIGWAEERCGSKQHTDEKVLTDWLFQRAMKVHGAVGKARVKTIATEVAKKYGLQCAHFDMPKVTFD